MGRDTLTRLFADLPDSEDLEPIYDGVMSAKTTTASATAASFTVTGYDATLEFGPAPYPRSKGAIGNPPRGTACAVAFEDGDPNAPLILAIYGWTG